MRKFCLLSVFVLLFSTTSSFCQEIEKVDSPLEARKNTFFIEPFAFLGSGIQLGIERVVHTNKSLFLSAGYYLSENSNSYNSAEMEGFKLEAQFRFHIPIGSKKEEIIFFGPYANYRQITLSGIPVPQVIVYPSDEPYRYNGTATAAQLGILAGYKMIFIEKVSAEVFFGGGLVIPTSDYYSQSFHVEVVNPYKKGFNIKGGMTIGYLF